MTVEQSYQQSLTAAYGAERALQACLPTCFYMLARAHGYLKGMSLVDFMARLDWDDCRDPGRGWLRAPLSVKLRQTFDLSVVSWMVNQPAGANFDRMIAAGYVTTDREIAWFEHNVVDWPIDVVVAAGTPTIVTMQPGFAANQSLHAVVLAALTNDTYEIIDPDERNSKRFYTIPEIHAAMAPNGAASIVLPPS